MTKQLHGRAYVRGAIQDDTLVTISGGAIADAVQTTDVPAGAERTQCLMVPGFIDCHIHGGDGADFMDADDANNARILSFHARNGTTALASTTLSGSVQDLPGKAGVANLAAALLDQGTTTKSAQQIADHFLETAAIHAEHVVRQDAQNLCDGAIERFGRPSSCQGKFLSLCG